MRFINELRDGDNFSEVYLCKQKQNLKTKTGKSYYSLILQDKTGSVDGKVWELNNGIEHFDELDYIRVDGMVTVFQGVNQLNIRKIRKAYEGEYIEADYLPVSLNSVDTMYIEFLEIIENIENEYLKELLTRFFVKDEKFIKIFKGHSAAKNIHHSFVGGLLEHTLSVVRLCIYYAKTYPIINKDLLITGAIFHDIGKVKELSPFPENSYTREGQLLGHISIGASMVNDVINQIDGFPMILKEHLIHLILSHHGELEYGSPKKPSTIEALALNMADMTDSKIQTMTEILNNSNPKDEVLGYNRLFEVAVIRTKI